MADYGIIIIGGGPAGYTAALEAAEKGAKVACIENRELGGTCLNRGCVPTKTLLHASEIVAGARKGEKFGIRTGEITVDLPAVFARKDEVSRTLSGGIESLFKKAGVDWIRGTAQVIGTGRVLVKDQVTEEGVKAESEYTADHIVIASGSVPARPRIPGLDLPGVMTSDELLQGCDHVYDSIVIIGGGVIGVELAVFYSDLGADVTVVEGLDRLLPIVDREIGQNLGIIFKKRGIHVFTSSMVSSVEKTEAGFRVNFKDKKGEQSVEAEAVLSAIGRAPNTAGIVDPSLNIEMDGRMFKTGENYETSIPGVYAVGDAASRIQLAHYAAAQATDCVDRILGIESGINLNTVPSCIYTVPEIACTGMTQDDAKNAGTETVVGKYVMFANAKTFIDDGERSFIKIVADKESHKIVGAQIMCGHATDMISEFTTAIDSGLTLEDMAAVIRPHPTYEEGVNEALADAIGKCRK